MKRDIRIIAFLCNWCSYAGADLAGTSRLQYPPHIRIIRVPCSGRINPIYIINALMDGADGVLVSGCHPGDCHYLTGNLYARRRFTVLKKLLATVGIDPERVQFTWVSASEGNRFADVVREVTDKIVRLGPNPILPAGERGGAALLSESPPAKAVAAAVAGPSDPRDFAVQQQAIRDQCRKLFVEGAVDVVFAYTDGGLDGAPIPFIAKSAEDAGKIVWGGGCWQNLATYLHGRKDRAGIVAKPCDARAVAQYVSEGQLTRDKVYIIGVDCPGMTGADGAPRPGCGECTVRVAPVCDARIEDDRAAGQGAKAPGAAAPETAPETKPEGDGLSGSFEKFRAEIDKCILCFSCRQACYACYCKTCFIERDTPDWQPAEVDAGTKMTFHLGRAMHLAGRCTECGACEAVCASGVNVRYIVREATDFIEKTYGFRTGMDTDTTQAMLKYNLDDREVGFFGGTEHE